MGMSPHDMGVGPHDMGVGPHDMGVSPHDSGVSPHDSGVSPHDSGVISHETGVGSHDTGVISHETGVGSHDTAQFSDLLPVQLLQILQTTRRPSVNDACSSLQTESSWQQNGDSRMPFCCLHSVALKKCGIAANAPAASTTRRSQVLTSRGFSASIRITPSDLF
jgi:hypothetical protein